MKAVDLWVFVCLLFVFSTLAEYGYILHLTSRSAWQKKIDNNRYVCLAMNGYIHSVLSKDNCRKTVKVQNVQLLSLKIRNVSDHVGTFTPDTIEKLKQVKNVLTLHTVVFIIICRTDWRNMRQTWLKPRKGRPTWLSIMSSSFIQPPFYFLMWGIGYTTCPFTTRNCERNTHHAL